MPPTLRWTLLGMIALLSSCAAPAPQPGPAPTAASADRFAARTMIIADVAPILAALPPDLETVDAPPAPADPAALAVWAQPADYWREVARRAGAMDGEDAAVATATRALLDAALSDGLALAERARAQGHAVSDNAVLAEIAWRMIAHAHPLRADAARAEADVGAWADYWRGAASAPGVITGRLLGAAVADAVIARPTAA
ncbi:MAG: hypothetical protein WCI67_17135 [Chloroflexales bacterium]